MKRGESIVKGNSFGASGFTLGVLGILSLGLIGVILSVIGFIFCLIQQLKKPTKLGKAGIIVSILGIILSLLWIFVIAPLANTWLQQSGVIA
ncbi:hypothetical protein M0R19_06490 [Candidatus Pacearchaeota archaeon]|nr:hypothetical protein [Candidatus Pacearchaeota archaeon]